MGRGYTQEAQHLAHSRHALGSGSSLSQARSGTSLKAAVETQNLKAGRGFSPTQTKWPPPRIGSHEKICPARDPQPVWGGWAQSLGWFTPSDRPAACWGTTVQNYNSFTQTSKWTGSVLEVAPFLQDPGNGGGAALKDPFLLALVERTCVPRSFLRGQVSWGNAPTRKIDTERTCINIMGKTFKWWALLPPQTRLLQCVFELLTAWGVTRLAFLLSWPHPQLFFLHTRFLNLWALWEAREMCLAVPFFVLKSRNVTWQES